MAGQREGSFLALAPFRGRRGAFSRLPSFIRTAQGWQKRVINATELYRIRSVRGSLHSLVVCTCVLLLASAFLPFAACVAGRHANSLRSKVKLSSSLSTPARFPPFPPSPAAVSDLQAEDSVSAPPPLGLRESQACLFSGEVRQNTRDKPREIKLPMHDWAEHVNNSTVRRGDLSAYQTTHKPGYERQFGMSFVIPRNLAPQGTATLQLARNWEGYIHHWECPVHVLEIIELADDGYLKGRRGVKETGTRLTRVLEDEYRIYDIDVSKLVYGRNMEGHRLHLLFREQDYGCLSRFDGNDDDDPPFLALTVNGEDAVDADYGEWVDKGGCRVPCKTPQNFKCQERSCTPGANGGEWCVKELLVRKVYCEDPEFSSPCTCRILEEVCARGSFCDETAEDGAQCKCDGRFKRKSVEEKTVCVPFTDL